MNIAGAVVIFVILWWTVFFAVLPWGVRSRWETGDDGVAGADPGAPAEIDLKKKALVTTGITVGVWALVVAVVASGVINFRE